ncbi:hypothetical protein ABIA00_006190 [Bradyrhizobium ottawaense]
MSITGHTDIREIERYCREAARKKLAVAAMTKLESGFNIKLPNPSEKLGESVRKSLKSLTTKAKWRSQQKWHQAPYQRLRLAHRLETSNWAGIAFWGDGSPVFGDVSWPN